MADFDDFDIHIQCDEIYPNCDFDRGLTADERDDRSLHNTWREQCFDESTEEDEEELDAVFGSDDEDNFEDENYDGSDEDLEDDEEDCAR